MERRGSGATAGGPALICLTGEAKSGKTRLACAVNRGDPQQFGERSVYVAIDPEAARLGSVLLEDVENMEVVTLSPGKDVFSELKGIYEYDWKKEGIKTVITDTMTIWSQDMMAQLTNAGNFSDKHIQLSKGGNVYQPMPGDFLGTETLLFDLLRTQVSSGMNHISLYHEREDRPEAGQPGKPVGGPATVGRASIRKIAAWYNSVLRLAVRQKRRTDLSKPVEYERVLYTAPHDIWLCGLRTPHLKNPIPEIIVQDDPANVWSTLRTTLSPKEAK